MQGESSSSLDGTILESSPVLVRVGKPLAPIVSPLLILATSTENASAIR